MLRGNEVALSQGRMIEDEVQVWAGTTWKPEDLRALTPAARDATDILLVGKH